MIVRSASIAMVCLFAAWLASVQPTARPAAGADAPAEGVGGLLETLPEDIDLAVVVRKGAAIRASPWGDAAGKFLGDAGTMAEMVKAWEGLAGQMGWSSNEAFDRLLGGRVAVVSKGVGEGNDRRWALLSDVSAETEQRLKERLLAAPRAIVEGHQILTLENGEYELATHHWDAGGRGAGASRVTLVLGATGKGELFDEILRRLTPPAKGAPEARTLAGLDVMAQVREAERLGGVDAPMVMFIGALGGGGGGSAWGDFILLSGQPVLDDATGRGGATWRSRVVVRQRARREELLAIEATSDASFRALSSGSLLAVVQNAPLPRVIGSWARFTTIGALLPLPDEAKRAMGSNQAAVCRVFEPGGRVSCSFGFRSSDTCGLARSLDGPIAAWISRVERQLGVETAAARDYAGLAPNAVRVAPFADGGDSAVGLISSRPLVVSWVYPSWAVGNGGGAGGVGAPGDGAESRPGWWVVNVSQSARVGGVGAEDMGGLTAGQIVRTDADALVSGGAARGGAETARWVWLATARPSAVERLLPEAIPDVGGVRSALRRLDWLDMRLKITEAGDVQGDLDVRLAPTPAGAGTAAGK
ncbi:MAG TPA: hypothetical protein PKE29_14535 [Phycisphaerales bacterium]|nr:hypothetical protein [Phycisphaerales bacterium]